VGISLSRPEPHGRTIQSPRLCIPLDSLSSKRCVLSTCYVIVSAVVCVAVARKWCFGRAASIGPLGPHYGATCVVAISSSSSLIVLVLLIPGEHTPNPANISLCGPAKCAAPYHAVTKVRRPPMIPLMSLIYWLPNELIIEIATLLDAPSLVRFESVRPFFLLLFPLFNYPANLMLDM
jgi:hypothetical protein